LSAAFFAVYRNPVLSRPAVGGEFKAVRAVEAWRGFRYNAPNLNVNHVFFGFTRLCIFAKLHGRTLQSPAWQREDAGTIGRACCSVSDS